MKRIRGAVLALLLVSLFLLSACSDNTHPMAYLSGELAFTAHLSLAGETYLAEVSLSPIAGESRDATVTLLSPSSIAGIVFKKEGEKITASLDGCAVEIERDNLFSFLKLFHVTLPLTEARSGDGEKTYVFSDKESTHTVTVKDGIALPTHIRHEGPGGVLSIEILP